MQQAGFRGGRFAWAALLLFVTSVPATAGDSFVEARDAFRLGDAKKLARLSPQLKKHELAAYVDYFNLRMELDQATPGRISEFLDRHAGEYVAEKLRGDWLRLLGRQGRWTEFDAVWPLLVQPDAELSCYNLRSRRQRGDASATDEARGLWLSVPELPEGCNVLMREIAAAGRFDADAVWERVRRQVEANRLGSARTALAFLAAGDAPAPGQFELAVDRPETYLGRQAANFSAARSARELTVIAVQRLARSDPPAAAAALRRVEAQLSTEARATAWGQVAWQAAQRHLPEAREWYRAAVGVPLSDEVLQWKVRAALRAQDWNSVRQTIEAMPDGLQQEPAWVYWLGRAYKAGGRGEEAAMQFARIAEMPTFYGSLAAEELGQKVTPPPKAAPPSKEELTQAEHDVSIRRALAFFNLGLRFEGNKEWGWALRSFDDRQLLAAAELARRQSIYDRAINAADKTRSEHDYNLRYLTPFDDKVRPAAKAQTLDDAWVYGLMRQESRFITDARSSVGASGLMQLMPATARWVAKKIGLKEYRAARVNDTSVNLMLGTSYLRLVMESLDNHPVLASAAYNAGPGRARRWRDPDRQLEGAIYVETIPFSETRDYVKKVMSNSAYYSALFSGQPVSLKARLGIVARRGAGEAKVDELP